MAIIDCVRTRITIKSIEITAKQQIEHTSATGDRPKRTNERANKTIYYMNCAINSFCYYLFNRNDFSFRGFFPGSDLFVFHFFSFGFWLVIWVFDWLTRHFVIVTCGDRCFTLPINLFMKFNACESQVNAWLYPIPGPALVDRVSAMLFTFFFSFCS